MASYFMHQWFAQQISPHRTLPPTMCQVLVLARGALAVYAAVRAVATARLIAHTGRSAGHDIAMQPVLQPAPKTKQEAQGIRIYLYRIPLQLPSSADDPVLNVSSFGSKEINRIKTKTAGNEDLDRSVTVSSVNGGIPGESRGTHVEMRASASTNPRGLAGSLATVLQGPRGEMGCIVDSAGAFAVYRSDIVQI